MSAGEKVIVVGGGLAGSEAAWQLAVRGVEVELCEMRPELTTPAHISGELAELVCSNSLRSREITVAAGLLKEELTRLGSLLIAEAHKYALPAGGALAVDRKRFSRHITKLLSEHPKIKLIRQEVVELPDSCPVIIASGPLTSDRLSAVIKELLGERYLYFYDAISPTVTAKSINLGKTFQASRYDKGAPGYINCPLTEQEYELFYRALLKAESYPRHQFELDKFFEGCLPIEELARREKEAMRFGPLKPVGLVDPKSNQRPYAVVQLRPEDRDCSLYNLVGFQTRLRMNDQREIFSLIPALAEAEFVRLGSAHRNTYINSPHHLERSLKLKGRDNIWFAGQLVGTEGYCESIAMGLIAGLNVYQTLKGKNIISPPPTTMLGSLLKYITTVSEEVFQPMNSSFGLLPAMDKKMENKLAKKEELAKRALNDLGKMIAESGMTIQLFARPSRPSKPHPERPARQVSKSSAKHPPKQIPGGKEEKPARTSEPSPPTHSRQQGTIERRGGGQRRYQSDRQSRTGKRGDESGKSKDKDKGSGSDKPAS
jgi:methylenetetrahydrofolate--tRNA-(uracil-5-)-methyltransferase